MISKIYSFGLLGLKAYPVEIETDVSNGLPATNLVGLADTAIKESRERVRSAIKNSGFHWPAKRITINLAPSNIKKEGASFDLAIALGILASSGQIDISWLKDYSFLGELSLDGKLRPVNGVLPIGLGLKSHPVNKLVLPEENAHEAGIIPEISVWPMQSLKEVVQFLADPDSRKPFKSELKNLLAANSGYTCDFSEVMGQYFAKRAIEVAVAGNHNIIMIGPPGSGKTMLAKRIPTIMPDLSLEEALDVTKIYSVCARLPSKNGVISARPFSSPHHSISSSALIGGGNQLRPGEISLSHQGVLFLDELPEFHRDCLEALRQPLEDGCIRLVRANHYFLFPASFMLVCAMNPCKCGHYNDPKTSCRCSTSQISAYRSKVSGPLLDRIDIHIEIPAPKYQDLTCKIQAESSIRIKERIDLARDKQTQRLKDEGLLCNGQMNGKQVRRFCVLGEKENELLKMAMNELNLSARAYDKILKVSRTIADLDNAESINTQHLSEAIQYRSLDRQYFT